MTKLKTWVREGALAGVVALALGMPLAAHGAAIYDNGAPNQVSGTQMSEFLVADDFTIGAAADITNIRFWSIQSDATDYTGSVYWAIYSDAAGTPGAVVQGGVTAAVTETATGNSTGFGYAEYVFDIPVVFTLNAGSYWLGLHNGPLATIDASEMLWGTTDPTNGNGVYLELPGTSPWIDSGNEQAFRLDGTPVGPPPPGVPEPGTLALVAGGLAAAAFRRRVSVKQVTTA